MSHHDSLLGALVWLTGHFGHAKSPEAIIAGLDYTESGMDVALFQNAAKKLGYRAALRKIKSIKKIPPAVLPCVAMLRGESCCIVHSIQGEMVTIIDPKTQKSRDVPLGQLQDIYAGYALYVAQGTSRADQRQGHWLWQLVWQSRGIYARVIIASLLINLFALVGPLFVMNVYDRVIPYNALETGWALGIGVLIVYLFDFVLKMLRGAFVDVAGRKIDVIAGRRIFDHVLDMKLAHKPQSSGAFANSLKDFESVKDFFTSATMIGFVDLPFSLLFIFVIGLVAGPFAAVLFTVMAVVALVAFLVQLPVRQKVKDLMASSQKKHGILIETIQNLETVKAIRADGALRAKYTDTLNDAAASGQSSRFYSSIGVNFAALLQQSSSVFLILMGMYMVRDGDLSMGALIASVILSGRALAPLGQVANLMTRAQQSMDSLSHLNKIMATEVERPQGKSFLHRDHFTGAITLDRVGFSYPQTERKVLDQISFSIQSGERVGIIGRIGSGKSTLSRVIMGLYEPDGGVVLYDEADMRALDPADIRRHTAYIAQDAVLMSGTIRDNIVASMPQADDAAVLRAAQAAGAHEFISRHPLGYDAPVGENGQGLSGGQRQAIALARAYLVEPSILICDEPTNAMDIQAEQSFVSAMQGQLQGKTLILVTHRQSLLSLVDRLILLDQGQMVADGPREKVLEALSKGAFQPAAHNQDAAEGDA